MAAVIRLQRRGSKKNPFYRIVVADKLKPVDGRFIEILGTYNPVARGQQVELKVDLARTDEWVSKGALPSDTVASLLRRARRTATAPA